MPTAPAADQRRLLALQALDTSIDQARRTQSTHPSIAKAAELEERARALADAEVADATAVADIKREVTKAEDDVQAIRARSDRDAERLGAGQGTPKDLQALQSEIEALARRRSELEDIELDAMERLEAAEAALDATRAKVAETAAQIDAAIAERDAALGEAATEEARLLEERAGVVDGLDAGLLALYEKLRPSHGGVGAAALVGGQCQGCHVAINPATLGEIASAAPDAIVRCDECGRILVREV